MEGIVLFFFLLSVTSIEAVEKPAAGYGRSRVPAMYILGDSLADVGNNNHLLTIFKADFAHNGIDFAGGEATGRFSNGKNSADFISEELGLSSPPPYLAVIQNAGDSQAFFNGINFASAGAGILDATSSGECLSLNNQICYLSTTYASMVENAGNERAQAHLTKSIFVIVIGSNDIFDYVNSNGDATPQQFVTSLISTLQGQIKRIYNIGARKFVFLGTAPVGCCPSLRIQSDTGECNAFANSISDLYNVAVSSLLQGMKSELADMNYSFFNTALTLHKIFENPSNYGFTEVEAACCGLGDLNAKVACIPISSYCSNRTNHVFWDLVHPTEATVGILAADLVDGSWPQVYPVNLRQLGAL